GEEIQDEYELNVRLNKDVCPVCSKVNSGYYETVVQLRSQAKLLNEEKIAEVEKIINKTMVKLKEKDKLAYIPQRAEIKEGVDYYIGSLKSGRKLAIAIQNEFGGVIKESPRLISQDKSTGKGIYRVWISIRLPEFNKGDFIEFKDKIAKVLDFNGNKIIAIDLDTLESFDINWKESTNIKLLKTSSESIPTTVTSKSPNTLQILDPESYEVVDFPMNENYQKYSIGDEIKTISINNRLYII
ncbi:MAG: hypothetical protein LBR24_03455, partial [Methanobrevibacter sp.]|nr:hypothetical protein [Methanobrevibacter sp.]